MLRFMAQQSTPTAGLHLAQGEGLRARLFCDPGASVSQKAAALEVALPARAAKELVRSP